MSFADKITGLFDRFHSGADVCGAVPAVIGAASPDKVVLGGAVTARQTKALAAGQKALAAAKRTKRPKVAKAATAAGNKAIAVAKAAAKVEAAAKAATAAMVQKKPDAKPAGAAKAGSALPPAAGGAALAPRGAAASAATLAPRTIAKPAMSRPAIGGRRSTVVGDEQSDFAAKLAASRKAAGIKEDPPAGWVEANVTGPVEDASAALSDLATNLADFVGQYQSALDTLAQMPPADTATLVTHLNADMAFFDNFAQNLYDAAMGNNDFMSKKMNTLPSAWASLKEPLQAPGSWLGKAQAAIKLYGPVDETSGAPGVVASVTIYPPALEASPGVPQQFSATVADAAGNTVTPKSPLTWSVSPAGAVIDSNGNFTAQNAAMYTVTAKADGVSGTASANVTGVSNTSPYDTSSTSNTSPTGDTSTTDAFTTATDLTTDPGQGFADEGTSPYGYDDPYGGQDPYGSGYADESIPSYSDDGSFAEGGFDEASLDSAFDKTDLNDAAELDEQRGGGLSGGDVLEE